MSVEGGVIAGRYRLHQKIGGGAMGVVWRAVDERLNRTVAVKQLLLKPGHAADETEEARQRAMREGRIAARLQHKNAIAVHDVVEHDGLPVLVMEYLPSQSLAHVLAEQGVLPPLTVAGIGSQVAAALAAAHQVGIVHRDLKPGNILLGADGTAKITDFGISRAMGDIAVTRSGVITGTLAYLAPETAVGCDPAPASDVFSLGATLYAAVEGEPPFGLPENAITLLQRVARGHVTPPRHAGPMTEALVAMLQPDAADRPTMAEAQGLVLRAFIDQPLGATSPPHAPSASAPAEQVATQYSHHDASAPGTSRSAPGPVGTTGPPPAKVAESTAGGSAKVDASPSPAPPTAVESKRAAGRGRPKRRRRPLLWGGTTLIALLVGVLAVLAYVNAAGMLATDQPSRQEIEDVVRRYYSLTPENLDQAFQLLGPKSRSQGKDTYETSWMNYADTRIVGPLQVSGNTVEVTLDYTLLNGAHTPARATLGIVVTEERQLLINVERESQL